MDKEEKDKLREKLGMESRRFRAEAIASVLFKTDDFLRESLKIVFEELRKKKFDDREFDKFSGSRDIILWKDVKELFGELGVEVSE